MGTEVFRKNYNMTNHHTISELDYDEDNDMDYRADVFNLNNLADSSDEEHKKAAKSTRASSHKAKAAKHSVQDSASWSEKFRELQDENTRLRKISAEKDYEIKHLKKRIDEEKKLFDGPVSNEVAATKIIELGKKIRELNSQLESERTKNAKLNKNVKDLENKLDNLDPVDKSIDESKETMFKSENKELKEKINQLTHSLMEVKSQAEILKQDLKKAHKALEKEIGENVDIKSILSGQTNWKGRQQQIILLQNKVETLKKKVSMNEMSTIGSRMEDDEFNESGFMFDTRNKAFSMYSGSAASARTNFDRMHMDDLRRMEKDKREKLEKLKKDNEALEVDYNKMKEKFDSMKVRNSVLTNENKTLKDQVKTLIDKGKHDNELIEMLMKKQNQYKDLIENLTAQNEKVNKEIQEKNTQVQVKEMQEKNTVEQLKSIISERDRKIKHLEQELKNGSESKVKFRIEPLSQQISFNDDSFVLSRPPSNYQADKKRPSSSGNNVNKAESLSSKDSLSMKMIEQRKEQNLDYKLENSELKTLHKSSEVERLRLVELVKTLQKRIDQCNEKNLDMENKYNEQRRKLAHAEKQLERFKLTESKSGGGSGKKQGSVNNLQSIDNIKLDELETGLLIQKDENDALKAALKSTLEAKEEDLRLYCEMLESTKTVFLEGLKQYKNIAKNDTTNV